MMRVRVLSAGGFMVTLALGLLLHASFLTRSAAADESTAVEAAVDYQRDIRPILSNTCYGCHGPDMDQRQADLRLDQYDAAVGELPSGDRAIVPGNVSESLLVARITAEDQYERMPPPDSGKGLAPEQIELIKKWIEQGAPWSEHWSFIKPKRPVLPPVKHADWPRGAIDRFILARLERQGLAPSTEADRTTLIRRVTFDLTGLPPTIEEVDRFLLDNSPDAYEKLVDRLLDSPRYGEHMARHWLDAARYGDTHGLHLDNERSIWPYRDWVIEAFNANMPFDQFTIEQLAGDLLPEPTTDQLIATGFNRCNVTTSEGGSIDEEYIVRYAVDRVETTGTVWMGLTVGCAVCHDHKYDPVSQREFYEMFAFFNSLTEKAMDGNRLDPPPVIKVPSPAQQEMLDVLAARIATAEAELEAPIPEIDAPQEAWQQERRSRLATRWHVLDPLTYTSSGGSSLRKLDDGSVLAEGENPADDVYEVVLQTDLEGIMALRLEALTHESLPHTGPGRAHNANFVLSEIEIEAVSVADPSQVQPIRFTAAQADFYQEKGDFLPEKAIDGIVDASNGWAVAGYERREDRSAYFTAAEPFGFAGGTTLRVRLRHESQYKQHGIGRFRLAVTNDPELRPTLRGPWHSIGPFTADSGDEAYDTEFGPEQGFDPAATYGDDALSWTPRPFWVDGKGVRLDGEYCATYLYRTLTAASPRQMTVYFGSDDAIKVWLNGQVVLDQKVQRPLAEDQDQVTLDLAPGENHLLVKVVNYSGDYAFYFKADSESVAGEPFDIETILALAPDERSHEQNRRLRDYYRRNHSPQWQALEQQVAKLREEREQVISAVPTTLVMQEMDERRDAYVLIRGEYDKPGEKVDRGVPAILPPLPEDAPPTRLGLALWLVDEDHPLTARVTVNRFWQQFFGTGIVKTSEDFGSQGEWPSHPELLDWLAVEFIESGWDVKALLRRIVTSATYRQASAVTPEHLRIDPQNRLVARGPRFRLDAEMIRDQALAVSGLLNGTIGGRSVKPYQPPGLWEAVGYTSSNTAKFVQDEGDALYRRSLYTFWKRTAPPPTMLSFDAPSREACTVRRARTNTPLQALALLNDVQYVEAARHLAERMMTEGGQTPEERVALAMRLATSRHPRADELRILLDVYAAHLEKYQADRDAAVALLSVGESPRDESLDVAELAAWTMVANLILNLDETVTKG